MYPTGLQHVEWFSELESGEVFQSITATSGRVRALGSFWAAELAYPDCRAVDVGEYVKILGRKELTLLVVPNEYRLQKPTQLDAKSVETPVSSWLKKMAMLLL